jgi:hypothetical protein
LQDVEAGFYIDVAQTTQLTQSRKPFYDKGFVGINIEPEYEVFKTQDARPNDINLNLAVSSTQNPYSFM